MTRLRALAFILLASACSPRATSLTTTEPASSTSTSANAPPVARTWMQPANDVSLSVHARGGRDGGPAVIVIHGGPGISHQYTLPLESLATSELRFIGYDQRGVGASSPAAVNAHRLEEHVADLEVLRLGQAVERVHLLAHSWGAVVAMAYTIAHPDHVASLVLIDGLPPSLAQTREANERFDAREKTLIAEGLVPAIMPLPIGADCGPTLRARLPVYYANPRHPATKDLGGSTCTAGILQITYLNLGNWDLRNALGKAMAPPSTIDALVIEGAADPFGTETSEEIVAALGSRARRVVLPACGHLPWEECPDALYPELRAFYASHAR